MHLILSQGLGMCIRTWIAFAGWGASRNGNSRPDAGRVASWLDSPFSGKPSPLSIENDTVYVKISYIQRVDIFMPLH